MIVFTFGGIQHHDYLYQACEVSRFRRDFPHSNTFSRSPELNQKSLNFAQNFSVCKKTLLSFETIIYHSRETFFVYLLALYTVLSKILTSFFTK